MDNSSLEKNEFRDLSTIAAGKIARAYLRIKGVIPSGDAEIDLLAAKFETSASEISVGMMLTLKKLHDEYAPLLADAYLSDEGRTRLIIAIQGGILKQRRSVNELDNKSDGHGSSASRTASERTPSLPIEIDILQGAQPSVSTLLPHKTNDGPKASVNCSDSGSIASSAKIISPPSSELTPPGANFTQEGAIPGIDPQLGIWSWNPLPTHEPDPHAEFFCSAGELPHGLRYVAARARGKKHKHEGTHCDDWYEVSSVGPWSLIAVSDGAGSKRISRVGARACTNEALSFLKQHLVDTPAPSLASRKEWTDALQRDDLGNFVGDELRRIQDALAGSIKASFDAVGQAFEKRKSDGSWSATLERDPELKDFRSTILVSLMCPILFDGEYRVFCLSVQVGDGLTVMYSDSAPLTDPLPLGAKDSGEYSSETEFLVDFKKWAELPRKIAVTVTPFRMLVSMTDGIDDIYDPRSGRDYNWILGELVLNQISPLFRSADSVDKAIEDIGGVGVVEQAVKSATQPRSKRLMASPETAIHILDIGEYAKALGKRVGDLITRPEWLLAAHRYSAPITDEQTIEQRLLSWIDGKDVKGEFDDRAIVILFPDDGIAL